MSKNTFRGTHSNFLKLSKQLKDTPFNDLPWELMVHLQRATHIDVTADTLVIYKDDVVIKTMTLSDTDTVKAEIA